MKRLLISIVLLLIIIEAFSQQNEITNLELATADSLYQVGKINYEQENYLASVQLFTNAIKINPGNSDFLFVRALSNIQLNKLASAKADIELAISLEANQPDYHYYAGNIYFKLKNYEKAKDNYLIALKYNGVDDVYINEVSINYNLGTCYILLKSYTNARKYFTDTIEISPDNGIAYYNRGITHKKLNDHEKACKDFRKAIELGIKRAESEILKTCK